jgi:hypothetical protein
MVTRAERCLQGAGEQAPDVDDPFGRKSSNASPWSADSSNVGHNRDIFTCGKELGQ